ncbi:MAG: threonyl-tRNA synthetase, threonyl-tRNA synthetase [Microgenomates group bacterium GW2011_GWC1_43_13]|nr:MAG: threonyl-tRNA synthetase, threonyl-tRNA synthetase [Microgenomates group bacterium GW2011_GWC1_43_13]
MEPLRHSTAHLLAAAVTELWPNAKPTLGPAIADGFYYDFDFGNAKISEEDFPKIEERMHTIIKTWKGFEKNVLTKEEALKEFADNPYKKELIEEHSKDSDGLTVYQSGGFRDLCRGGHSTDPKEIKYFKLLSVAGAYWRGDEKQKMLTRIYGTVFPTQKELDEYLTLQEEAKKRDHRKLGRELDLFTFSELVGAGLPLYTPKGALLRRLVNDYVESVQAAQGYTQVWTPQIAKAELFKTSGHYDKYKDSMFKVTSNYSEEEYFLKPMNCPQHTQIYASKARSYRDLPIRLTDFAMLYRDEKPGELSGLARVRAFSQDDCHVFCREDQVDLEVDMALAMTKEIMKTFGLSYKYRLSTHDPEHPEKYIGDPKVWEKTEEWAEKIMKRNKIEYIDGPGEAAFYAPKMDLIAKDSLGREWQLSTIQIDFFLPERFDLEYVDSDGAKKRPVMIHRAIVGSPERFLMVLIEHFAGNFPTWLAPVQVKMLPITERNLEYAVRVAKILKDNGIRVEVDDRSERLQAKIRDAQLEKAAYMLIVGDKEEKEESVSKRGRSGKDYGPQPLEKFVEDIKKEIEEKIIS